MNGLTKLVEAGMRVLVKAEDERKQIREDQKQAREEMKQAREEHRQAREEMREIRTSIRALIEAQMRTDAKLDRLVAVLLRTNPNGRP